MKNKAVFTVILKIIRNIQDLYRENSKVLLKETKVDLNNEQDTPYSCKEKLG